MNNKLAIDIHQIPKSPLKFILLTLQHVFAMFGANVLVPILVNQAAGMEIIPIQVAFLCSGLGTLIYLIITQFKVPIYLGSSFAFLGAMTTLWASSGYNIFLSIMIVGIIYCIVSLILYLTKSYEKFKKILSPVIIGTAIMVIGFGLVPNAAKDMMLNSGDSKDYQTIWVNITIGIITFLVIMFCLVWGKSFIKMIPILVALAVGFIVAMIMYFSFKYTNNDVTAQSIFTDESIAKIKDYKSWKWYPDISTMWKANTDWSFDIKAFLAIIPLSIVTLSEHVGDHINLGHITNRDFIAKDSKLYRTILGDGVATFVSACFGGPPNTSYGENTSVISVTKIASVWVIAAAALSSILLSFLAPLSVLISIVPKAVIGGIGMVLFAMISINGLKLLINNKVDFSKPRNIIMFALISLMGIGGAVFKFSDFISLSGAGIAILFSILLNIVLPDNENVQVNELAYINLAPNDILLSLKKIKHKTKTIFIRNKKNKKNK